MLNIGKIYIKFRIIMTMGKNEAENIKKLLKIRSCMKIQISTLTKIFNEFA